MKKHKLLLLSFSVLLASCSDEFFDLTPNDKISANIMYKTAEDFNLAVISCYSKLQSQVSFYTECCEYRSDNFLIDAPTTGTQDRYDIDQFQENQSNVLLSEFWANFNNNVYRCNMVLDRIDEADIDGNLKKQYKGEALFIRAFNYFNMYRTWGGVPTTRKVVTVDEALQIGRSSDEEMLELIAGDLKQIVDGSLLPETYSGNDVGRVTLGAARALLGKVYLTFHKWTDARDALTPLIGGAYTLLPEPGDVFKVDNKMNGEIIFAVRFNKTVPGEGHGFWWSMTSLTNFSGQSPQLLNAFTNGDKRRALIEHVAVPGESNVYALQKFFDTRDATTNNVGNDQIILRYADVLLMYAEALNRIGFDNTSTSPAMTALNAVHTRAGLAAIQPNDPAIANQDSFNKAIMLERQLEFPYEGHRWFDIVRMGEAKAVMALNGHTITDYQFLFPIPKTELERINNEALLWQNPGYN
ncbi:MAG: RagB/SusD family nutrient uptake outer membrane protein [Prevotellaceae bacterium]|jgi:hypothetical protein|nr:RagB/SusD family nutrient uptake outer membrane protein [Prevotellaceae bacterium]